MENDMKRTWVRFAIPCAWLLATGCAQDERDEQSDTIAAAAADASVDADEVDATAQDVDAGAESDAGTLREPVDQTPPSGANGVAFDAEGMLLLADLFGRQVLRVDPGSGEILARFAQNSRGPDDVAIDVRGRLFWTDWSSGEVGRFDPQTGQEEVVANLPPGVNSIAFTDDGRLFVGLVLLNRGLYELDPEGVRAPRLVSDAIGVNAFDFGRDGLLWGPSESGIVKLDPEGGEVVETVVQGGYASVRYSERERAFFAVTNGAGGGSPGLDRIDPGDHSVTRLAQPELARVDNFAIGPQGEFVVTAYDKPSFVVISADGSQQSVRQIGAAPSP
jgi:hypothetical protein